MMGLAKTIATAGPLTLLLLSGLVWDISGVNAYSSGAPSAKCSSMSPNHGTSAQMPPSPVGFSMSSGLSIQTGDTLEVTLNSTDGTTEFKGFLLEARLADNPDQLVGTFDSSSLPTGAKILTCLNPNETAVTHSSATPKSSVTVIFRASGGNPITGPIFFRATIVNVKATFWENVDSPAVQVTSARSSASQGPSVNKPATMVVLLLPLLLPRGEGFSWF